LTRSNGREVEQSVTVSWRISHVNHEKGDSLNHWQFHTRFEYFVPPSSVLVQGGRVHLCISLTPAAGPIADPLCYHPVPRSPWKNMSADRKATFKQPPRHVMDTALTQEVRRIKVCRYETTSYNRLHLRERGTQALEEQKRVRHILVASGCAIQRISYI
jgi:hypothetical protein